MFLNGRKGLHPRVRCRLLQRVYISQNPLVVVFETELVTIKKKREIDLNSILHSVTGSLFWDHFTKNVILHESIENFVTSGCSPVTELLLEGK